jgi:hypothetical protein
LRQENGLEMSSRHVERIGKGRNVRVGMTARRTKKERRIQDEKNYLFIHTDFGYI